MNIPKSLTPILSLDRNNSPTWTEIIKINHTISTLKQNEAVIMEKLGKFNTCRSIEVQTDLIQHTHEVSWGWKDLLRLVNTVPDTFLDKYYWQHECHSGLIRTDKLLMKIVSHHINDTFEKDDYNW